MNPHPSDQVEVAIFTTLQNVETGELHNVSDVIPIGDNIYRPLVEGYRVGDDAQDVLAEALEWWTTQLDTIDEVVASKS